METETQSVWWCKVHDRTATMKQSDGTYRCDFALGGIMMPCSVVKAALRDGGSPASNEVNHGGYITKEMWTVIFLDNGKWCSTDIFEETEADAASVLEFIRRNAERDIKPSRWSIENSKLTRCLVSILLPVPYSKPPT